MAEEEPHRSNFMDQHELPPVRPAQGRGWNPTSGRLKNRDKIPAAVGHAST
jgi:hypothetical protein